MTSDLQLIVDQLSARVGAAVVLEDHEQRTLAHSSQAGRIDSVRRDSILHRATSPELMSWFRSFGILEARSALRIPANHELEILARICAPARYRNRLLGFLWLIDAEGSISEDDVVEIERAAEHAAVLIYEDRLAQRLVVQALSHLLSPSEELREAAAGQLVELSLIREAEPTVVVVLTPLAAGNPGTGNPVAGNPVAGDPNAGQAPGGPWQAAIEEALFDVGWQAPTGTFLRLAHPDHGILLVRLRRDDDTAALELAESCRRSMLRRVSEAGASGLRVVAALGDPQHDLDKVVSSYRQARLATKVSTAIPALGDVVRWRDLGIFRALVQLPNREAVETAIDPRVAHLLQADDESLVVTLETYLDLAGDAKATAERLHLHRGTLYYRLEKIERLSGIDMRNGYDRLAAHLGLKLARLAGRRVTGAPMAVPPGSFDNCPSTRPEACDKSQ
ncbi:MAG TPA: helix-turn-helix domain-containing protein [Acidimicrobiales bacterium]|nr:helix-turn-helix domain-containing protein [Acidimicrobiales bacterium]